MWYTKDEMSAIHSGISDSAKGEHSFPDETLRDSPDAKEATGWTQTILVCTYMQKHTHVYIYIWISLFVCLSIYIYIYL